jgi:pimeloyl-ACP methyl ester carboxylesterase
MLQAVRISVNGVSSAVHDAGSREASEAVVFVHGTPGPMDDWEELAPAVGSFARVIALDMPGFGRAGRPREFDFTLAGYACHLGGVLDQLGVRRAHLVLHDMGGPWGLRWAVDHPGALASLTLINTGVLIDYEWHTFARIWQTPVLGELLQVVAVPWLIRLVMNRDNPRPLPRRFTHRVTGYADWRQKMSVNRLYRSMRETNATFLPLARAMSELNPPTCIIWGAADKYLPLTVATRQTEVFPRAELHVLAGLGHWPFIDDPEAVRSLLLGFLRRHLSGTQAPQ